MNPHLGSPIAAARLLAGLQLVFVGLDENDDPRTGAVPTGDVTPGAWRLDMDSCDCGGDYPCGHPDYPYQITATTLHGDHYSERTVRSVADLDSTGEADGALMAEAVRLAEAVVQLHGEIDALRAEVEALRGAE